MMCEEQGPKGSALEGVCPSTGFIELFTAAGRSVILPTTCKTWRCVICRRKLLALFRARVEHGVSTLGRCSFITITYKKGTRPRSAALIVSKEWTALWKALRRENHRWKWLKVTELTKVGTPHHHLLIGPVSDEQEVRCHGREIKRGAQTARYNRRRATCQCLSHIFSRQWLDITGDSFMCFATEVTGGAGAGGYMGKYLDKGFTLERWPGRRYTSSRDWPGGGRLMLARTKGEGWAWMRRWSAGSFTSTEDLNPRESDLLARVGTDLMVKITERESRKKAVKFFKGVLGYDPTEG